MAPSPKITTVVTPKILASLEREAEEAGETVSVLVRRIFAERYGMTEPELREGNPDWRAAK